MLFVVVWDGRLTLFVTCMTNACVVLEYYTLLKPVNPYKCEDPLSSSIPCTGSHHTVVPFPPTGWSGKG